MNPFPPPLILFAEDDDEDWLLLEDVLDDIRKQHPHQASVRIERVKDGQQLVDRLRNTTKERPLLVMLDLRMPRKDGTEALQEIRADRALRHIPIVMMTSSKLELDILRSYQEGANSYLVKPVTQDTMAKALRDLHHYWANVVQVPSRQAP